MAKFPFHSRAHWDKVIADIEKRAEEHIRQAHIKSYDFGVVLPEHLRERIKKILPYEFDDFDRNVYIEESSESPREKEESESDSDSEPQWKKKEKEKKKAPYNESTCSEIERMENEFPNFEIKIDTPMEHSKKAKKKINWASTYLHKTRKERVKWDTKIYDMDVDIKENTLDAQAEMLMDASAERFVEWLNSLGSGNEGDITQEKLKELFSIEGEKRLFASIQIEPVEVKAIAKTVADKWNLPEMAIELKYENYLKNLLKNVPKKMVRVAFGRTVPAKDLPWLPSDRDAPITTIFPDDLRSGEKLFKGITHLRSTKKLVEFLRNRPHFNKPRYLVECGSFKQKAKVTTTQEVPLYELLRLKY